MAVDPLESRLLAIEGDIHSIDRRVADIETGQKWLMWVVGITLAMVVGNFAVTIAMAIHMLGATL